MHKNFLSLFYNNCPIHLFNRQTLLSCWWSMYSCIWFIIWIYILMISAFREMSVLSMHVTYASLHHWFSNTHMTVIKYIQKERNPKFMLCKNCYPILRYENSSRRIITWYMNYICNFQMLYILAIVLWYYN